jgi:Kef-type K+ transport system membrane component KefB
MLSLTSAAVVSAIALLAPLAIRLVGIRLPEVVLEIVLGVVVGPQVLGWARTDQPVRVLAIIGLAFLLMLSGLEIDFDRLRGQVLRLTSAAFALSFVLAIAAGSLLGVAGLLQATSLSIPVVAGAVGVSLHLIRPDNYAALVAAGLLSVIAFPLIAQPLLTTFQT